MELPEPVTDLSKLADLKVYPDGEASGTFAPMVPSTGPGYIFVVMEYTKQYPVGNYTYYFKVVGCGNPWTFIKSFLQPGNPRPLYFFSNPRVAHVSQTANALEAAVQSVAKYATTLGGGKDWFYVEHQYLNDFWSAISKAIQPYIA